MALWGKTDTLGPAPKYITRKTSFDAQAAVSSSDDTIDLSNSSTNFATGDGVIYTGATGIGLSTSVYYVKKVDAGKIQLTLTEDGAKTGATGVNLTAGATGTIGYLQRNREGNESTGATGVGDHTYNGQQLIFVDADEAAQPENRARGLKHVGWWLYRTWTNADGSVAHHAENLVALGAYRYSGVGASGATGSGTYQAQTGDSVLDDIYALDSTVTIIVQPTNVTITSSGSGYDPTSFTVGASILGVGALTYQWQYQTDSSPTWTGLEEGQAGIFTGVTTTTLSMDDVLGYNGYRFRCVVGTTTAHTDVMSATATLTVN